MMFDSRQFIKSANEVRSDWPIAVRLDNRHPKEVGSPLASGRDPLLSFPISVKRGAASISHAKNEKAARQQGRPSLSRENSSNGGLPSKLSGEILWAYKGGVKEFL